MRTNKKMLFLAGGFLGGAAGALLAEMAPKVTDSNIGLILGTAAWSSLACALLTCGLFAAGEIYRRRPFALPVYRKALVAGALAGAISGGVAQCVFSFYYNPGAFYGLVVRSLCWGIMGSLLGWRLAAVIPNLGVSRGLGAGGIGGILGGAAFVISSFLLPEALGRMVGVGALGAALGVSIVVVEEIFRSARLEIIWAPKEVTSVTLGANPVFIGGGDDHIYVNGLPPRAVGVSLESGSIQCDDKTSGRRTHLKDGSRIQVGTIEIVVHAKGAGAE